MLVLGIESSCDDTSVSVVRDGREVLSCKVSSQEEIHQRFGGVVPELASRQHLQNILPVIDAALEEAGQTLDDIDGIAVTSRPGLVGSLVIGISAAKAIAWSRNLPLVGVDHLAAHAYSVQLLPEPLPYPHLCLLVSGGHTLLSIVEGPLTIYHLGTTVDDAAGEAFDKVSKLLGLGYPGGPILSKMAAEGNPTRYQLPRPMMHSGDYDFSFSGLKTAARKTQHDEGDALSLNDFAASVQEAIVDVLVEKSARAIKEFGLKGFTITGGVAANRRLRAKAEERLAPMGVRCVFPDMWLCTDNAAMIAGLGYHLLQTGEHADLTLNAQSSEYLRSKNFELPTHLQPKN